jgi:hypothetical protein
MPDGGSMTYVRMLAVAIALFSISLEAKQLVKEGKKEGTKKALVSSKLVSPAFASAYTQYEILKDGQSITNGSPVAIHFSTNQPRTPQNIQHPVNGDDTQFKILEDGTYLVGWTLSLEDLRAGPQVLVQLWNATLSQAIGPDPVAVVDMRASLESFDTTSGQTIVRLTRGTVLQLRLQAVRATDLVASNPTFFITKVGL